MIFSTDTWNEIYHALSNNKVRTFITMIGVAWSMFLFVALLGVVNGLRNGFDRDLAGTSTNSMFVWTQQTSIPHEGFGRGREFDLKLQDIRELKKAFPEIKMIAPRNRENSLVIHGTQSASYSVYGDYPEQNKMFKKKIIKGRFLTSDDLDHQSKVCVLGEDVVSDLYEEDEKVVGSLVTINNMNFVVVGMYKKEDGFEGGGAIHIPYNTFQKIYNEGEKVAWMAINIYDQYEIKKIETEIKDFLKVRHRVHPDDTQAFGSFNLGELFGKLFSFMKGLEVLTITVGFLTLFAGAIAVSSILLITVKERTKEFGIRRALGAKPIQIILQILLEATVITSVSALIGVIMATLVLSGINTLLVGNPDIPLVNSSVDIMILLSAGLVIMIIAVLSGFIPALRAIQIKPIDALRED